MASVEQLGKFPEGKILLISPVASVSENFPVSFNDYIIQTVTLQHIMLIAMVHGSMTLYVAKGFMY